MTVSSISVADMHCSACADKIRRALADTAGVAATHINPARRQVLVEHGDNVAALDLLSRIEQAGFQPTLSHSPRQSADQRDLLKRLGIAGLAMMQVMMAALALYAGDFEGMTTGYRRLLEWTSLIFCIPVVGYSAMPFFTSALRACRSGLNMDVPIALAIAAAFSISLLNTLSGHGAVYYDSVVMFTFLLLTARYVDDRLKRNFDVSSTALAALPGFGWRLHNGERNRVALQEIATGDRVWVPEGDQIPLDGRLESASAALDESVLTGESVWVTRTAGNTIYAGTLNCGAAVEMTATAPFDRTRVADIAALADRAQAQRPPVQLFADAVARLFIPAILTLAGATWLAWQWFDPSRAFVAALTVLVVSCPCALSLATPAAVTAAMTRLRQLGVVLTRSNLLEQIPTLNRALVDKTGTLTVHEPRIERIELLSSRYDAQQCLDIAAALQAYSSHPYAQAFSRAANSRAAQSAGTAAERVSDVSTVQGAGVQGRYGALEARLGHAAFARAGRDDDHAVYLTLGDEPVARFEIQDAVRPEAAAALAALRDRGIAPTMVSGDAEARCAELASLLRIDYVSRQAPETKLQLTRAHQQQGDAVLVVGDGINDVPALAAADVSVAVLESNDLVKSHADVLLLTRRLGALVDLVDMGYKARRIIRQNLGWALAYNLIAIPVAALGYMPPWLAALGMASSSTLVMLNAARLMRVPGFSQQLEI